MYYSVSKDVINRSSLKNILYCPVNLREITSNEKLIKINELKSNLQWSQIFIKDGVNEGEDLELDELNYSHKQPPPPPPLQRALADTPATSHQLLMSTKANASPTSTPPEDGQRTEKNGDSTKEARGNPAPVVALRNGKTQTSLKTMSKRKISQQKEKKATQMLAIVLGESVPSLISQCR